ncbi:MAG: uridine kinase [Lachnospiraceae bacterium]|nr:uridine kinase [Lachnospiraceae bacterium]
MIREEEISLGKILVVGIAGGSGSGKTTLTNNILRRFGDQVSIVHHDNYYRSHHDLTLEERSKLNYDSPESLENELIVEQLRLLREGRSIECPLYDFSMHDRKAETVTIHPKPVILVEGILIFAEPALAEQMDIKVFVDTDADIRLSRRIMRDVKKRGRSLDSVIDQWRATVKPMYELYVEPTKKRADIIIPEGGKNPVALDMLFGRLERHLNEQ